MSPALVTEVAAGASAPVRRAAVRRGSATTRSRRVTALVSIALAPVTLVMLTPLIWTVMSATRPLELAFASPPKVLYSPTPEAFRSLWQETESDKFVSNSVLVGVLAVAMTLVLVAPAV